VSSWWLTEDPAPEFAAAGRGPVDVEVVGAGMTGISAALTLARAGLRVRVRDARRVAEGASGRNGGFALRGGATSYDNAREQLGREQAAAYWRATEAALDRLAALGGDALRRVGSLRLADDQAEREELRLEYDALREDGLDAEWRDSVHGGRFPGAIFHPRDGATQPARLVRRLAAHAAAAGADVVEGNRVSSLDELEAEHVVVATDGYPSGLLGALADAIVPTRGQVLVTEPLGERLFACPHYSRHGFDYWQQTPEGRIVAGGFRDYAFDDEWTAEEATTPAIQGALESFVTELAGRPLHVERRWAGIFGSVRDKLPLAGRVDGRVWVAAGYSGHGNVVGFLCGELVGRAIAGDEDDLLGLFDPARFSDVELRQV
jgi:glycine/D-amino acid oxidase-like deaminating enzyme